MRVIGELLVEQIEMARRIGIAPANNASPTRSSWSGPGIAGAPPPRHDEAVSQVLAMTALAGVGTAQFALAHPMHI